MQKQDTINVCIHEAKVYCYNANFASFGRKSIISSNNLTWNHL